MLKKILLLLSIAFVVVCYGYPFLVLPFGQYSTKLEIAGAEVEMTVQFSFEGEAKVKIGEGEEVVFFYEVKDRNVELKVNSEADPSYVFNLDSLYEINFGSQTLRNDIGMYAAIGVGALAVILVLLPTKKSRR